MDIGQEVVEEVHTLETAQETADTTQLTTSEQEEKQTFVITGSLLLITGSLLLITGSVLLITCFTSDVITGILLLYLNIYQYS